MNVDLSCGACGRARSIYALYACKACAVVQCGECVQQTISAYFCPQCLAPYASRQAHELDSRCRRCAQCPRCQAPLQTAPSSAGDAALAYACPHCLWSSAPSRLWPSAAAMATDALKLSSASAPPWAADFASILASLASAVTAAAAAAAVPSAPSARSLYVRGASSALKARASSPGARAAAAAPPFSLAERLRRDVALSAASASPSAPAVAALAADSTLHEPSALATVAQRNADVAHSLLVADLRERRVRLETRCTKRCCACNTLLVKPDKALDQASFSERNHTAVLVLPFLTAAAAGADVRLTFENTTVAAMSVSVLVDDAAAAHVLPLAPADDAAGCRASLTLPADVATTRDLLCTVTSYQPPIPFKVRLRP